MVSLLSELVVLAQRPNVDEWVNVLFIVAMAVLWIVGALIKNAAGKKKAEQGRGRLAGERPAPRETWQQRLARKAQEIQRAAEEGGRQVAERVRQMEQGGQPQRPAQRPGPEGAPLEGLSFRKGQGGETIMVYDAGQMGRARRPEPPRPPGRKVIRPLPPAESASQRRERAERLRAARRADAVATRRSVPPRPPAAQPPADLNVPKLSETSPGTMDKPRPVKPPAASPAGREATSSTIVVVLEHSDPDTLRKAILHYEILGKPLSLRDPFGRFAAF